MNTENVRDRPPLSPNVITNILHLTITNILHLTITNILHLNIISPYIPPSPNQSLIFSFHIVSSSHCHRCSPAAETSWNLTNALSYFTRNESLTGGGDKCSTPGYKVIMVRSMPCGRTIGRGLSHYQPIWYGMVWYIMVWYGMA